MYFDEALALFLSYRSNAQRSLLTDRHQKKSFVDLLCHQKNGLPTYLVENQYVVLRSRDVYLDFFLEEISQTKDDGEGQVGTERCARLSWGKTFQNKNTMKWVLVQEFKNTNPRY